MGMGKIISWYQKKIGTYDKEHWEKTSEEQILHGLSYVSKKSAKLRTELIDVDLVRGSSFPKSKPKHGILTVARLAIKRVLFFPYYRYKWKEETSSFIFLVLFHLYILQLINMTIFIYYKFQSDDIFENISSSEIFVPFAMMYIIVMIHIQIVSTHMGNTYEAKNKTRRIKRAKRRNTRIRTTDNKNNFESTSEKKTSSETSNKLKKSTKIKKTTLDDELHVWDSKAESDSQTIIIKTRSKNEKIPDEKMILQKESREKNNLPNSSKISTIGKVVPQDDDGFESLTGNGSSENGEEIQESKKQEDLKNNPKTKRKQECESNGWDYSHKWVLNSGIRHDSIHIDADIEISDSENVDKYRNHDGITSRLRNTSQTKKEYRESNYNSSCDSEDLERCSLVLEGTTTPGDWLAITTNSEECSYSSEIEDTEKLHLASSSNILDHSYAWEYENFPTIIPNLCSVTSDKVSCTMWDSQDCKKVELSVIDISTAIITKVESMSDNLDYFYGGLVMSLIIGLLPSFYRLLMANTEPAITLENNSINISTNVGNLCFSEMFINIYESFDLIMDSSFGTNKIGRILIFIALIERWALSSIFIFLLVVAERTFKQRLLYAKLFSHLTSLRRSIKSELPHFRLNKVRNIKNWLSVRSYLKKHGPQRSVNVIVSAAFIITLLLLSFLSIECLKDSLRMHLQYNLEALIWCMVLGVFLLRFMTLGTNINIKYRNLSVLLTEQINLYLQIEQKPNKKDELMVANSVLKLAADLLKELESPFKISGLAANPYLYTITKVVILSALSAVLSELLGFKLKLHKLKVK